jgi:hypothetical protein
MFRFVHKLVIVSGLVSALVSSVYCRCAAGSVNAIFVEARNEQERGQELHAMLE